MPRPQTTSSGSRAESLPKQLAVHQCKARHRAWHVHADLRANGAAHLIRGVADDHLARHWVAALMCMSAISFSTMRFRAPHGDALSSPLCGTRMSAGGSGASASRASCHRPSSLTPATLNWRIGSGDVASWSRVGFCKARGVPVFEPLERSGRFFLCVSTARRRARPTGRQGQAISGWLCAEASLDNLGIVVAHRGEEKKNGDSETPFSCEGSKGEHLNLIVKHPK
jgi:hypothetical protein